MPEMINVEEARAYALKRWPSPVVRRPMEALLDDCPRAAKPVQHGENTSYIITDDVNKYHSRIILVEGVKSKRCRVFYEDDREHGRWVKDDLYNTVCSVCGERIPCIEEYDTDDDCGGTYDVEIDETTYCPNCGAKMDLK